MISKKTSESVWNDAIWKGYESKIRTILIQFSDGLGYDDSQGHRDAFNKAFSEISKLFRNI